MNDLLQSSVVPRIYLIDNSPTDVLRKVAVHPNIEYIFNNANLGYGAAHNIALRMALESDTTYHVVINPDIALDEYVLADLCAYMDQNRDVGQAIPKVFYPDGRPYNVCKLLPAPLNLIGRRYFPSSRWLNDRNKDYELHQFDYDFPLNAPSLSGCFMFFRVDILRQSGLFDPRFFLYMEDYDLVRRIHRFAKTTILPSASITHKQKKESYSSLRMMMIHAMSAVKYFNKWGWVSDPERVRFNRDALSELEKYAR